MGIYVHVPFCRSKCFYCGFYSVASLTLKEAYLGAIEREIDLRRGYLPAAGNAYFVFRGRYAFLLETWGAGTNYSEVGGKLFVRPWYGANHRVESRRSGAGKIAGNKGFGALTG